MGTAEACKSSSRQSAMSCMARRGNARARAQAGLLCAALAVAANTMWLNKAGAASPWWVWRWGWRAVHAWRRAGRVGRAGWLQREWRWVGCRQASPRHARHIPQPLPQVLYHAASALAVCNAHRWWLGGRGGGGWRRRRAVQAGGLRGIGWVEEFLGVGHAGGARQHERRHCQQQCRWLPGPHAVSWATPQTCSAVPHVGKQRLETAKSTNPKLCDSALHVHSSQTPTVHLPQPAIRKGVGSRDQEGRGENCRNRALNTA